MLSIVVQPTKKSIGMDELVNVLDNCLVRVLGVSSDLWASLPDHYTFCGQSLLGSCPPLLSIA